jgi:spore maturation protein SpmB
MQELDKLNPQRGTATNAMALFLAINTSSITLLPTGVIALRAAAGASDPAAILPTTLFATIGSTTVAVIAAKLYQRLSLAALTALIALIPVAVCYGRSVSPWIIPALMVGFLGFGLVRRVRVYEVFVEGAKDGFQVAVRIIPYLVAILVAVDMLRASGVMGAVVGALGGMTGRLGLPAEALPMALMRPLSGSGAYGILAGSTETTFYVLAVYFGAVQVRRIRHSLAAALTADVAGVIFAVLACSFFLG